VYFVQQHKTVIDSRRYKGISVTKDMFKWTNQYKGQYEVVVNRPADMWKYSYGFHLYTDSLVTVDLKYLTETLVKAWYQMGIGMFIIFFKIQLFKRK
jgi:hypothetical protein